MNILKKLLAWFIGTWQCPQCAKEFLGLDVNKLQNHVSSHGLGDMASLLLIDVVFNLGGSRLYPKSAWQELEKWVKIDCQGRKIPRGEGLPTYRLF